MGIPTLLQEQNSYAGVTNKLLAKKASKICVAYELDGKRIDYVPSSPAELARVKPIYEEMDGWLCKTSDITRLEDLPPKAKAYVDRLVELSGAKLGILSIGPARESTLRLAL